MIILHHFASRKLYTYWCILEKKIQNIIHWPYVFSFLKIINSPFQYSQKHTVVFYDKVRKRYWTGFNGHRKRKASHFPLWQPVHLWVKYCMCGMGCLPTWSNLFFRLEFVLDAYPDQELHALTCNHWTIAVIKVSHVL